MPSSALRAIAVAIVLLAGVALIAAGIFGSGTARAASDAYTVNPLASDGATTTPVTDPSLVNGWGLSAGPTTPWWASDNGTNLSTLYSGTGAKVALTVSVPGAPTGTVSSASAAANANLLVSVARDLTQDAVVAHGAGAMSETAALTANAEHDLLAARPTLAIVGLEQAWRTARAD